MILSKPEDERKQNEKLVTLSVCDVIQEADDVCTFRLDNQAGLLSPHQPGMFIKVCLDIRGNEVWRSFSISSSPFQPEQIDLTIKRNREGQASNYFFEQVQRGSQIRLKGPLGQFYYDPELHTEPLVLLCAGIGITPMMSIVRYLKDLDQNRACFLFYGARTHQDIIFDQETRQLMTQLPGFHYFLTLSQPVPHWLGYCGHLNFDFIISRIPQVTSCRFFLCGPREFNQEFSDRLQETGAPSELIHSEQFHKKRKIS
ncbi:Stearoyl-CoA 9-desaturase electron transfer partner [Gimesia panareensis]|uniref:Stearoyl-CoA 9-desaturase electron transfer partner n=1 Tax=Gimesia panareensis TaxID=2527978 RepID=A0A517Q4M2_9PLAN|nr:ferredoxin reductase [Gimesia panareensis]QDT26585.1 Stearoyl-CoA 9-desaturase electron transfer partner [Gimesia panareensis]